VSTEGDPEAGRAQARRPYPRGTDEEAYRDFWTWAQWVGLALLAAGVAVLIVFALTVGGR
jgi:hypothetical protein